MKDRALRALGIGAAAMVCALAGSFTVAAQPAQVACNEMLGFSETAQWYEAGFVSSVPNPGNWQLRWYSGGSVDLWADPNYAGWGQSGLVSHCANGSASPERVVLNVSGDYQTDPAWWARTTQQVIQNIRAKYPRVQQIALQPVVGGLNGARCPTRDPLASQPWVRASFNYPYIKQGLAMSVGSEVVLGASPEVRSCADYADWAGHLPPSSAQPIGMSVARYWTTAAPVAAPAPPPAVAPPPAETAPPPAETAPPTGDAPPLDAAVPSDARRMVTFDDLASPGRVLSGTDPSGLIDWGDSAWWLSGPYGQFTDNSVSFNGAGPTDASFAFTVPHRLAQLDVYNGGKVSSTVSLSCDGVLGVQVDIQAGQRLTLPSGFTASCGTVGVSSSNGWDTNFNNLLVDSADPT